jgi:hypothetical protein
LAAIPRFKKVNYRLENRIVGAPPEVEIDVVEAGSTGRSKLDVESTPQPLRVKLFVNGYTVHPHALDGDTWGRPVTLIVVEGRNRKV